MPAYKYKTAKGQTKWYANFFYTDWTGKRKRACKRGFGTKREAQAYEMSFLRKEKADCDILFSELAESYLEDLSHRLKPTTMEGKQYLFQTKLLPYFGNLHVCDIGTLQIRKWQNELLAYRSEKGEPYSQTYLKSINNQMSAIMNYAVSHYGLSSNPCKTAGSIGKSKAGEMRFWTQQEYESFSKVIKKRAYRLAFDILFYTGIRSGELLALTPADILPDKKIRIDKNYAVVEGEALILEPKTQKSTRYVTIPESLFNEISEYISALYGIEPDDRIFYFTKHGLLKELKAGAKTAGLPEIRLHDLRHSHASMLINMGFEPIEIADRLGHESIKTTLDTYGHLYPKKTADMAEALDKLRRQED